MKRFVYVTTLIIMLGCFQNAKAQLLNLSVGFEFATMKGEFKNIASFGVGVSGGVELAVTQKFGLTAQIGYFYLSPDDKYSPHT